MTDTEKTRDRPAAASPPARERRPARQTETLVVVQAGSMPVDPELVERILRGDQVGAAARSEGSREVVVGERLDAAKLHPAVVASLIANRIAVPTSEAPATNAALRAEYGEKREAAPGVMVGVDALPETPEGGES